MMTAMSVRSVRKPKDDPTTSDGVMSDLDLDQDTNIHDQLPHPDTVKGRGSGTAPKFWRRVMIIGLVLLLVLTVVLIPLGIKASNSKKSRGGQQARMNEIETFLSDYVSQDALTDASSPQFKAANWMAHEDLMQVPISRGGERFLQRYSLAVLYFATQGDDWAYTVNFLTQRHECNWHQTLLREDNQDAINMGVYCDENENVETIRLQALGLSGTLPPQIAYFHKLETLALDGNNLVGTIPRLNGLNKLTSLTLTHNDLGEALPNWMSTLSSLRVLALSDNGFHGTIPQLWSSLTKLRELGLDSNELHGHLFPLMSLTSLEKIYLEDNEFTGYVGSETFMQKMRALQILDISNNKMQGSVPDHLLRLPNLEILDLSRNQLVGIEPTIAKGTSLRFLSLHSNLIEGAIPSNIQKLENLEHLDLSSNDMRGVIPATIGNLKNMTYLFLADNTRFEAGPVPNFIRGMTNLRELSLKLTDRTGQIPAWLGELEHLFLLDLDNNNFHGKIPKELSSLKKLNFLLLNRNGLTGALPAEMGDFSQLKMLMINNNTITGNADAVCKSTTDQEIQVFVSDCGGDTPEMTCECCSECCQDSEKCRDEKLLAHFDASWQNGYVRDDFYFAADVTFSKVRGS